LADIIQALEAKYGPPQTIEQPADGGRHLFWTDRRDVLLISLVPTWRGDEESRLVIYYVDNLDLLAIMLLGLWVGRAGALEDAAVRQRLARSALPWLLGVGLAGCVVWTAMVDFGLGQSHDPAWTIFRDLAFWPLGAVSLGLGYAAAVTLLMRDPRWRRRFAPFAPVGRMALTNYLVTTLVVAIASRPWGLGHYGGFSPAAALLCVLVVYALQVAASRWWLARFRFGPVEWLWRSLTYRRLPPMRRDAARG
jgi:uncharacterized protein